MIVACVYKTSKNNLYTREDVRKLASGVGRHLRMEHQVVCLTDDPDAYIPTVDFRQLNPEDPGWWAKMSLFHPQMFPKGETIFYIDLDTVVCGNLDSVIEVGQQQMREHQADILMLRDTRYPEIAGSGVMMWVAGACHRFDLMYQLYRRAPDAAHTAYIGQGALGDQGMISEYAERIRCWQDFLPADCFINLSTGDKSGPDTALAYCSYYPKLPALYEAGHPLVRDHWI